MYTSLLSRWIMFNKKTIKDIDVKGKHVLVRVDFNVPLDQGKVRDDTRIRSALPTINYLLDQGAALILCSHLGRPKGEFTPNLSLKPVAEYLQNLVDVPVLFVDDCRGFKVQNEANKLRPGEILVLENTRFYPGEKVNDPEMAKELASVAEVFVDDAFGTAHRAHASNVGVADYLPCVAGLLMEKEIKFLGRAIDSPDRPLIAILGGAKVSDKIGVIKNLFTIADHILIGGGMANTFFKAQGYQVGDSLVEDDSLDIASDLMSSGGDQLHLPVDVVLGDSFDPNAQMQTIPVGDVPDGWRIMDIGPDTINKFSKFINDSRTIVWNGPMGVFEFSKFSKGTFDLAKVIAESNAVSVIGGGDSVAAVNQSGLADNVTHISTGGGAFLELLEGKTLPGLAAINDK
jgi:phosphoglycerate kinase